MSSLAPTGMSGGIAWIYDPSKSFEQRALPQDLEVERLTGKALEVYADEEKDRKRCIDVYGEMCCLCICRCRYVLCLYICRYGDIQYVLYMYAYLFSMYISS